MLFSESFNSPKTDTDADNNSVFGIGRVVIGPRIKSDLETTNQN